MNWIISFAQAHPGVTAILFLIFVVGMIFLIGELLYRAERRYRESRTEKMLRTTDVQPREEPKPKPKLMTMHRYYQRSMRTDIVYATGLESSGKYFYVQYDPKRKRNQYAVKRVTGLDVAYMIGFGHRDRAIKWAIHAAEELGWPVGTTFEEATGNAEAVQAS